MRLRVGTRGSPLALIQTRLLIDSLRRSEPAVQFDVVTVRTEGDRNRQDSLTALGGRGVFVQEIEQRLLSGEIDLAVHSLKDLPSMQPDDLVLAAMLPRADASDALVARDVPGLDQLPPAARVGSSSLRRAAQLLALRPGLQIAEIRGNVDTRLRKLDDGQYDAIVLASAGLERMNLARRITHHFSPDEMLPAVAQGIIAAECRVGDAYTRELLAGVDDAATRAAADAERGFLRGLGGGCQLPIAAFAELHGSELHVRGLVAQPDGARIIRAALSGEAARAALLGDRLAEQVLASGARELMEAFDARSSA